MSRQNENITSPHSLEISRENITLWQLVNCFKWKYFWFLSNIWRNFLSQRIHRQTKHSWLVQLNSFLVCHKGSFFLIMVSMFNRKFWSKLLDSLTLSIELFHLLSTRRSVLCFGSHINSSNLNEIEKKQINVAKESHLISLLIHSGVKERYYVKCIFNYIAFGHLIFRKPFDKQHNDRCTTALPYSLRFLHDYSFFVYCFCCCHRRLWIIWYFPIFGKKIVQLLNEIVNDQNKMCVCVFFVNRTMKDNFKISLFSLSDIN